MRREEGGQGGKRKGDKVEKRKVKSGKGKTLNISTQAGLWRCAHQSMYTTESTKQRERENLAIEYIGIS
jgi:hypothetical protein